MSTVKAPLSLRVQELRTTVQVGLDLSIGTQGVKVLLRIEIKPVEPKVATRNKEVARETRNSKNSKQSKSLKKSKQFKGSKSKKSKQFKGLEQQQKKKKKKTSSRGPISGPKAQRFKDLLERELKSKRS